MTVRLPVAAGLAVMALLGCADREEPPACTPSKGTICTVVGNGDPAFYGDGGRALRAALYQPLEVLPGPEGLLFVLDWSNHRVRQVDGHGTITTIAGTDGLGDGPDGPALTHHLNHPVGLALDAAGDLMVAAWHNSKIKRLKRSEGLLLDFCGSGRRAYFGDGRPAREADLDLPSSLAYDRQGRLVFAEQGNHVIRRIRLDGTLETIAGQCIVEQSLTPDGEGLGAAHCEAAEVPRRCSDGLDAAGRPIASDKRYCGTVAPKDVSSVCENPCSAAFGGDGGPATSARIASSSADPGDRFVLDHDDHIFLADTGNSRIRRIDARSGVITTVAGRGDVRMASGGYSGDGGPATDADLNFPSDVAVAHDGTIFIADTYNHCVRRVDPQGVISTFAGRCRVRGDTGDGGPPSEALLKKPYGVALAANGDLYIADTNNHRIRVVLGAATP